jgi:DNA-binding beta-propeller fold protein YncE
MKPVSVGRLPRGLFLMFVFVVSTLSLAQPAVDFVAPHSPSPSHCGNGVPTYLGGYLSDGKFHPASTPSCSPQGKSSSRYKPTREAGLRSAEVPPFVDLHPLEYVIENYQPPARAHKPAKRRLALATLRDEIVTLAYGREKTLLAPQQVAVDSQGRLIISDPGAGAVHVLDGNQSFRIAAGANRRLLQPSGLAVDADDNIYVADPLAGVVVVYDRLGNFLHDIGKIGDETLFHSPTAIAIDRKNGHLYVLDTPRDVLFITDLEGKILKRFGKGRGSPIGRYVHAVIPMDLNTPTEIALGKDKLAVLDSNSSRIRILDLQCNVLGQFNIRDLSGREPEDEVGLAMDSADNLYLSNLGEPTVRIYGPGGRLKTSFGRFGDGNGEFDAPSGLWIDATNRMYVADTNNRRVQMFQLDTSSDPPVVRK